MSNDLNAKQGRSTQSNRDFHRPKNPKIVTNQPNNWDQVDWNTQKTPDTASKWDQERTPETYEYQGPTRPYSSGNPTQPPAFTGAITPNTARRQVHSDAEQAAKGFEDDADFLGGDEPAPETQAPPHYTYTPPTDPQGSQSQYPYQNQYQGTPDPSGFYSRVPVSGQGSMQPGGYDYTQGEDLM